MSVMHPEHLPCMCPCHQMPGVKHLAACCGLGVATTTNTAIPLHNPWDYLCERRGLTEPSSPDARCPICRPGWVEKHKAINRDDTPDIEELIALKDRIITAALHLAATERWFDRVKITTANDSASVDATHDDFDSALKKYLKARIAYALAHHEEIP